MSQLALSLHFCSQIFVALDAKGKQVSVEGTSSTGYYCVHERTEHALSILDETFLFIITSLWSTTDNG